MQQQQVDFVQAQPRQALLGGSLEIVRFEMGGPDLGRQKDFVAPDAGSTDGLADLTFVLIHLRGVDVTIAEPQRLFDQARAGPPAQFPGAQPDRWNFGAIGLDEVHQGYSRSRPIMVRRYSDANRLRFRAKWIPVRVKKTRQLRG